MLYVNTSTRTLASCYEKIKWAVKRWIYSCLFWCQCAKPFQNIIIIYIMPVRHRKIRSICLFNCFLLSSFGSLSYAIEWMEKEKTFSYYSSYYLLCIHIQCNQIFQKNKDFDHFPVIRIFQNLTSGRHHFQRDWWCKNLRWRSNTLFVFIVKRSSTGILFAFSFRLLMSGVLKAHFHVFG